MHASERSIAFVYDYECVTTNAWHCVMNEMIANVIEICPKTNPGSPDALCNCWFGDAYNKMFVRNEYMESYEALLNRSGIVTLAMATAGL